MKIKSTCSLALLAAMSTLVLNLDDRLKESLAALAARSRKPLPDWAAEQLSRLVSNADADPAPAYSAEWMAAFGSISDPSFGAPSRPFPVNVEPLDAE